ncbi:hypothetical protein ABID58_004564 [Bradyrhizobium sp. S3.2.6]|uniref:hypothetical protein n=1 Tax=Bradyrhizobium sp. S3.2.6 TaxID=3156428 RepID=UPI003392D59D
MLWARLFAGYVVLLHCLLDLPRKDLFDGDGFELLSIAFFAEEIIERGEPGDGTDCFLPFRHCFFDHFDLLHFSNSRFLRCASARSSGGVFRVFLMKP